jgi:hypothetical protein
MVGCDPPKKYPPSALKSKVHGNVILTQLSHKPPLVVGGQVELSWNPFSFSVKTHLFPRLQIPLTEHTGKVITKELHRKS